LPKVEEFPDYLFVIVNPLLVNQWPSDQDNVAVTTQLSATITETRLITYHEQPINSVEQVKRYLERHADQGRRGPDYIFHLILDGMVDEYAPLLDSLSDRLDDLEDSVFEGHAGRALPSLLHLKRRLTNVRKTLTYEREVLARMARGEFELIDERETVYYRNVYDHLVRFTELTESSREMVADLLQTHLSVTSNRLNEIMKVLTIFSAVILPMTMVTSVYGMNFTHMPEIDKPWGYPWALCLMAAVGFIPLAIFRWKRWI
jgi:magnesium transporter